MICWQSPHLFKVLDVTLHVHPVEVSGGDGEVGVPRRQVVAGDQSLQLFIVESDMVPVGVHGAVPGDIIKL